jgi:hypothetical protein
MNRIKKLASCLAIVGLAAVGARAQQINTITDGTAATSGFNASSAYTDGQLVLAFYSSSDASGGHQGDLLFDIGTESSFTGLASNTYSVAGFNGASSGGQPTVGVGSTELTNGNTVTPGSSTFWTVFGDNGGTTLYATGPSTGQNSLSPVTQSGVVSDMDALANSGANNGNANGSAYLISQGVYNTIGGSGTWAGGETSVVATTTTGSSLTLYQLVAGGAATKLGTFTLTDVSSVWGLTFTPFTAIPEPSTYAAILGAVTVGFVLIRRRVKAGGLSAVA